MMGMEANIPILIFISAGLGGVLVYFETRPSR